MLDKFEQPRGYYVFCEYLKDGEVNSDYITSKNYEDPETSKSKLSDSLRTFLVEDWKKLNVKIFRYDGIIVQSATYGKRPNPIRVRKALYLSLQLRSLR